MESAVPGSSVIISRPHLLHPNRTIGIVGSHRRDSYEDMIKLNYCFSFWYEPGDCIVSGGCPTGADRFAENIARRLGISILIHYAEWDHLGKWAGPARNSSIVWDCTFLIAMPAPDRTGGTEDTIKKARKAQKKVYLI